MFRASLFRLPVIITFINSAVLGMVLALVTNYYHSLPDAHPFDSTSLSVHKHNDSSSIVSELWHSHTVVCVLLFVCLINRINVKNKLECMMKFSVIVIFWADENSDTNFCCLWTTVHIVMS